MRLAILVLCLVSTIAHAQPANTSPTVTDEKSPEAAVALSLSAPIVGVAVMGASGGNGFGVLFGLGALVVGPSTGRWYAGEVGGGSLALRGAGVLAVGVGVLGMYGISEADCRANDQPCHSPVPFQALAIGGAGVILGTWAYDVVHAGRAADRWNAKHAVSVTPGLVGSTSAPGMFVSGSF